jgi:mannose-6-phosphate isomerase-like protein (cupin superfamily)
VFDILILAGSLGCEGPQRDARLDLATINAGLDPGNHRIVSLVTHFGTHGIKLVHERGGWWRVTQTANLEYDVLVSLRAFPESATADQIRNALMQINLAYLLNAPAHVVMSYPLILLAWLAGCGSPKSPTGFGRPSVLARNEGEARLLQGRKPIWIKVDPQTLGSRTLTVGMEDIPPGDSIGVHKHLQEDEVVFIHRGEVDVTLGDSILRAKAGAIVFIPRDTWIGFRVRGADTATIVFAFNTPGFEKCLRLLSAPLGTTFVSPSAQTIAAARRECHQVRRVDEIH